MKDYTTLSVFLVFLLLWTSTPTSAEPDLVFVHITDVHLCDEDLKNSYYGAAKDVDPVALFDQAVAEIEKINPDFVVDTGDSVANADKRNASSSRELFDLYTGSSLFHVGKLNLSFPVLR